MSSIASHIHATNALTSLTQQQVPGSAQDTGDTGGDPFAALLDAAAAPTDTNTSNTGVSSAANAATSATSTTKTTESATTTTNATVVNAFVVTTNSNLPGNQTGLTSLAQRHEIRLPSHVYCRRDEHEARRSAKV